eukprot:2347501-Rhodomonas_salina.4
MRKTWCCGEPRGSLTIVQHMRSAMLGTNPWRAAPRQVQVAPTLGASELELAWHAHVNDACARNENASGRGAAERGGSEHSSGLRMGDDNRGVVAWISC